MRFDHSEVKPLASFRAPLEDYAAFISGAVDAVMQFGPPQDRVVVMGIGDALPPVNPGFPDCHVAVARSLLCGVGGRGDFPVREREQEVSGVMTARPTGRFATRFLGRPAMVKLCVWPEAPVESAHAA